MMYSDDFRGVLSFPACMLKYTTLFLERHISQVLRKPCIWTGQIHRFAVAPSCATTRTGPPALHHCAQNTPQGRRRAQRRRGCTTVHV
eukprot:4717271-Pleurochrysis_carterae.AAC.3